MVKIPANKVKRAVKIAYLGQKPLLKMLFKVNLPVWAKAAEAEKAAFLAVGSALFVNPNTSVEEAVALLGVGIPAPVAGGLAEALLNPEKTFTMEVFVATVKAVLGHIG